MNIKEWAVKHSHELKILQTMLYIVIFVLQIILILRQQDYANLLKECNPEVICSSVDLINITLPIK